MRVVLLSSLLVLGCYAIRSSRCEAVGIGSKVTCSVDGAFLGETTPREATAVLAGLAGIATAVAAFF